MCACLTEAGRGRRLLVVPGGGAAADVVRDQDERFGLRPSTAHWMAILAMDQFGLLLADLTPGAKVVRTLDEARARLEDDGVVVLLPSEPLRRADPLPHSWSVTSDSIAAWLTARAGARLLVLLKDHQRNGGTVTCTGERAHERRDGRGARGLPARSTITWPSCSAMRQFDLWAIDGEHAERLMELLETGTQRGSGLRDELLEAQDGVAVERAVPTAAATGGATEPDDIRGQLPQPRQVGRGQGAGQGAAQPGFAAGGDETLELGRRPSAVSSVPSPFPAVSIMQPSAPAAAATAGSCPGGSEPVLCASA